MQKIDCGDVLIIGAGLAGIFAALHTAPLKTTILAAAPLQVGTSSGWAQGGIAAALSLNDSPKNHAADTMQAGCYLNDPNIVDIMTQNAEAAIEDLAKFGIPFDKDPLGNYLQGKEAAHSAHRIVKIGGDSAGRTIMSYLSEAALAHSHISIHAPYVIFDLSLSKNGDVLGVYARKLGQSDPILFKADHIVFATGGMGYLYKDTTNPHQIRGEALGIAARHNARLKDTEFVQFHPTALDINKDPCPLATEALRGKGAIIIDENNTPIMKNIHPDKDLAPRDIVSRAITAHQNKGHKIFLDISAINTDIQQEFQVVYNYCLDAGIDLRNTHKIPIKPAQHYHMGGIYTDSYGKTSLPFLYAIGEAACTGAHGANRLASNSLLEALIFSKRAACHILSQKKIKKSSASSAPIKVNRQYAKKNLSKIRNMMTKNVGIIRQMPLLDLAKETIHQLDIIGKNTAPFTNYAAAALSIINAARHRTDPIGAHFITSFSSFLQKNHE